MNERLALVGLIGIALLLVGVGVYVVSVFQEINQPKPIQIYTRETFQLAPNRVQPSSSPYKPIPQFL